MRQLDLTLIFGLFAAFLLSVGGFIIFIVGQFCALLFGREPLPMPRFLSAKTVTKYFQATTSPMRKKLNSPN